MNVFCVQLKNGGVFIIVVVETVVKMFTVVAMAKLCIKPVFLNTTVFINI